MTSPFLLSATTLASDDVRGPDRARIGGVEELMIDVPTGRIAYAIISLNGLPRASSRLLAIPWRALRLDTEQRAFVLDAPLDTIDEAEAFDRHEWPDLADADLARHLHDRFRVAPTWAP